MGITLAILSWFGNIPVFIDWFMIIARGFAKARCAAFINFIDMSSLPWLFFLGGACCS